MIKPRHLSLIASNLSALLFAGACTSGAPTIEPSDSARRLGIATYEITEAGPSLTVMGRAADGAEVATITLENGLFVQEDPIEGTKRRVLGRQLSVALDADAVEHTSEGFAELTLPPLLDERKNDVVYDPAVQELLAVRGVFFEPRPDPRLTLAIEPMAESGYGGCPTSGLYAPTSSCGATSCASSMYYDYWNCGIQETTQFVCCGNTHMAAQRKCTTPNGSTSCGTAGSGGCAVCWAYSWSTSCSATTFGSIQSECYSDFGEEAWWSQYVQDRIRLTYNGTTVDYPW